MGTSTCTLKLSLVTPKISKDEGEHFDRDMHVAVLKGGARDERVAPDVQRPRVERDLALVPRVRRAGGRAANAPRQGPTPDK